MSFRLRSQIFNLIKRFWSCHRLPTTTSTTVTTTMAMTTIFVLWTNPHRQMHAYENVRFVCVHILGMLIYIINTKWTHTYQFVRVLSAAKCSARARARLSCIRVCVYRFIASRVVSTHAFYLFRHYFSLAAAAAAAVVWQEWNAFCARSHRLLLAPLARSRKEILRVRDVNWLARCASPATRCVLSWEWAETIFAHYINNTIGKRDSAHSFFPLLAFFFRCLGWLKTTRQFGARFTLNHIAKNL